MRHLFLLIFLLTGSLSTVCGQHSKYSRATVWFDEKPVQDLARLGIDLTEGVLRKSSSFTSEFSSEELQRIRTAGFRTDILIEDLSEYVLQQKRSGQKVQGVCPSSSPAYTDPLNFSPGSMGGFYTYDEMLANLDSMSSKYPNLITVRAAIDTTTTIEGRPIYFVKISDNPALAEAEPHVLYTGVHHAREPVGISQMIYYMWYLLENYSSSDEVSAIVNNSELFFVPCVNPDGYIYNQTTNPQGGGFWRKNRRDNGDGTFGVDLNRNYGQYWGFDDSGSSPDGFMENYRGTAPFSEPETRAIRNFSDSMEFVLALNYHSYGNLLIYPWGHLPDFYTPDSSQYATYGQLLTTYNHFLAGTSNQTVQYQVNGGSDDWMYGEQVLKPKVFAMTPEVGDQSQGFWPQSSDIIPLCRDNMFANLTLAHLAGPYAEVKDISPVEISNLNDYIYYELKNIGLDTSATFIVSVIPVTANITATGAPVASAGTSSLQVFTDSVSISLDPSVSPGDVVTYVLATDNGQFVHRDTISRIYGMPVVVLSDNGNSTANWTGGWGPDNDFYVSPTTSISDSPLGDYQPNANNVLTLAAPISLANSIHAALSFYARWDIEKDFDYAQLQVSVNNGVSWLAPCGKYTVEGSPSQDAGNPVYEGRQLSWVKEEINLDSYLGQTIKLRFRLVSDGFSEYDGFYFDDVKLSTILATGTEELAPPAFSIYPNPASDLLFTDAKDGMSYRITDITGKCILNGKFKNAVDVSMLEEGIYNYTLFAGNGTSLNTKFVIMHR